MGVSMLTLIRCGVIYCKYLLNTLKFEKLEIMSPRVHEIMERLEWFEI